MLLDICNLQYLLQRSAWHGRLRVERKEGGRVLVTTVVVRTVPWELTTSLLKEFHVKEISLSKLFMGHDVPTTVEWLAVRKARISPGAPPWTCTNWADAGLTMTSALCVTGISQPNVGWQPRYQTSSYLSPRSLVLFTAYTPYGNKCKGTCSTKTESTAAPKCETTDPEKSQYDYCTTCKDEDCPDPK